MREGQVERKVRWNPAAFALGLTLTYGLLFAITDVRAQKAPWQVPIDSLIYDLRNPDPVRRKEAATLSGTSKVERAVPELVAAAHDKDPAVRREIILALERLSDIRALPAFVELSGDPEKDIREKCVQGIVSLYLRKESGLSVTINKVANFFNPWSDEWADVVVEPGIKVDSSAVTALSGRLGDTDESIRAKAARALGILQGKSAVPVLIQTLRTDSNTAVRFEVIRALRKVSASSAGDELIGLVGSNDSRVRYEAVFTLGRLRCQKAVPELTRRFRAESALPVKEQDNNFKQVLIGALASIGDPASENLFLQQVNSRDEVTRQHAFEGLARVGNPGPVTDVSRAHLAEKDLRVKIAQAYALFCMGRKEFLDEVIKGLDSRRTITDARQYLLELSPRDLPDLLGEIKSKNVNIREGLAEVLGMIGDDRAVPVLQELSKDNRGQITALCNQALRRIDARSRS